MDMSPRGPRKLAVSVFVTLNVLTILLANRPPGFLAFESSGSEAARWAIWADTRYGYALGLDPQWQMFSHVHKVNWGYVIEARYGGERTVLLPLPSQSPRTWWQRAFVDFKEAKFELNLYGDEPRRARWREEYSDYLRRQYPALEGQPLDAVIWQIRWENLRTREDAVATGTHVVPGSYRQHLDTHLFPPP